MRTNPKHGRGIGRALSLLGCLVLAQPAQAAEGGFGNYLLGLTFPLSGYTPPPGLYFRDTFLIYRGSFGPSDKRTTYNLLVDIATVAWYPGWEVLGGSLGFSAVVPYVGVRNKFRKVETAADGSTQIDTTTGTANSIGDTEFSAVLGWHSGEHHWNAIVTGFTPIGHFVPGKLGVTGLDRPALDFRGAYTYLGQETGLEATGVLGVTVNAINSASNYRTGTELHFEWSLEEHFPFGLHAGAVGYIYQQLTGDSGSGATNGAYIGRAFAVGPSIGYTIEAEGRKLTLSARSYHEFWVRNRPMGNSVLASLDFRF